ncbi:endonuclease [uncultured Flavobacterium sp.]|uniref:endonuclease n=1 Tax=uncultured Flavobacterium sp. TaxID=165435 RepID=UPI0030EE662C|tara:strand:+ start:37212 stop:38312 length:1101 start_codon:yes stop_codon:yes gene_type:complete
MKKNYILLFLLSVTTGFAQIPTGYYNSATGTGYTLKTNLRNIIANNTNSNSSADYGDLWTLYTNTAFRDNYYENNSSLLDIYSEKPSGPDSYEYTSTNQQCGNYSGEGSCYNREHLMPQSVFNSNYPMYSDAHFVVPSDGSVNGARGNFPFGVVSSVAYTSTNGSKRGSNLNSGYSAGYSGTVFEPINEFKGDVARAMLYFATRYQNEVTSWSYDMFNNTNNQVYTNAFLNILITWHNQDPVSAYEIAKNNAVYSFQNNRNPYIDHPEYVCQIWPTQCAALSTQDFVSLEGISVYPNPSNDHRINIQSEVALDEIQLINLNGQLIQVIQKPIFNNNTYTLDNLPQGFYLLRLSSENQSVTKKIIVN